MAADSSASSGAPVEDHGFAAAQASASPCDQPFDAEELLLDRVQQRLGRHVCVAVNWFDSLFGDERFEDSVNRTHGRIGLRLRWAEREGWDVAPYFRIRAHLPQLGQRWNLFVGRDTPGHAVEGREDVDETDPDTDEDSTIALGYSMLQEVRQRLNFKSGLRLRAGKLAPFAQAQYRNDLLLRENYLVRFTGTGFWRRAERFGATAVVDFDRSLGDLALLRWSNEATATQTTDGTDWQSTLTLFNYLGDGRALDYELSVRGVAGGDGSASNTTIARVIFRTRVLRKWLIVGVYTGARWARTDDIPERKARALFGFTLEALYGPLKN